MRRQLLVLASALVLAMVSSPTFANHKDVGEGGPNSEGHQNPGGLHSNEVGRGPGAHTSASHATTVDSNAGIGNGGEDRFGGDPANELSTSGDRDPGNSKDHNANN